MYKQEKILTRFALTLTILDYHRKAQQSEATVWILIGMQKFHISLGGKETQVKKMIQ